MIVEDEQGTFALLQLLAEPSAAYFGKLLSNAIQLLIGTAILSVVFIGMTDTAVERPLIFALSLLALPLALAGGASFCSALVMGAANRWLLAGVVALPMLVPVVFLGVSALRAGLGAGLEAAGVQSLTALGGYALVAFAAGPRLIASVWRND
jgi:ABC-type transport system involved in cytochrome c biogenesis permease component